MTKSVLNAVKHIECLSLSPAVGEVVSDIDDDPPLDAELDAYEIPHLDAPFKNNCSPSSCNVLEALRINMKDRTEVKGMSRHYAHFCSCSTPPCRTY